jgi:hypothetical protein
MLDSGYLHPVLDSSGASTPSDFKQTRRNLVLAPLLGALPFLTTSANAEKINPLETLVTVPDAIEWSSWIEGFPPHSGQMATLYGGLDKPGPYVVYMKWYPGYMSAPHTYATDRLSVVLSGTWWVNSGADFDPANAVPVPAGGFVRASRARPTMMESWRMPRSPPSLRCLGLRPSISIWWIRRTLPGGACERALVAAAEAQAEPGRLAGRFAEPIVTAACTKR